MIPYLHIPVLTTQYHTYTYQYQQHDATLIQVTTIQLYRAGQYFNTSLISQHRGMQ